MDLSMWSPPLRREIEALLKKGRTMAKQELQTNLIGREVRPGVDCGYLTLESVRADAFNSTVDYTEDEIKSMHKQANEQRNLLMKRLWGEGEEGKIVTVFLFEGHLMYTVLTVAGELRNMSDNHFIVDPE